jgi:DNA-binding transcriptional MerR regulator
MSPSGYTIGKLARDAGVNVETIRYYERLGLIRRPGKPVQGYRRYPSDMVARLRFIRRAQCLGFTLKERRQMRAGAPDCRRKTHCDRCADQGLDRDAHDAGQAHSRVPEEPNQQGALCRY